MAEEKKLLIIVHGVWPFKLKNKFLDKVRRFIFRNLTTERGILNTDYRGLANFLKGDYDSVKFLRWHGGISKDKDILPAIKRLENLIRKNKNFKIDILAVSLGGYIVQKAIANLKDIKLNKVLYLGAVHDGKHDYKNVNVAVNIYSKIDKVFLLANDIYNGMGNAFLKGASVVNISLPDVKHEDLCQNLKLKRGIAKDLSLYDFYKNILKNDNFSFLNK